MIKTRRIVMLSLVTAGLAVTAACSSSSRTGASEPVPPATGDAVSAVYTILR